MVIVQNIHKQVHHVLSTYKVTTISFLNIFHIEFIHEDDQIYHLGEVKGENVFIIS